MYDFFLYIGSQWGVNICGVKKKTMLSGYKVLEN